MENSVFLRGDKSPCMKDTKCVMCDDAITNPICPGCLQEGVQQWLLEQGETRLADEVRELTCGNFANFGDTACIKCDNLMSLCAYCYTKEVFHAISKHPSLVGNYLVYFNFDLEHMGWEQDARAYID